ncbi:MAG TPA: DUF6484 domain-containing protein [Steroidobacteraceae bacterium]|nr:DUF6484 domain-containing protein [Steroidobacteraceae bacterium]
MSAQEARVTPLKAATQSVADARVGPIAGARVGRIVGISAEGLLQVELTHPLRRCMARLALALDADRLQAAIDSQQPAVLVFENGDDSQPIVIGLIEATALATTDIEATVQKSSESDPHIEADVDGRRVRLTAKDEIVMECGQASITLRRNGRVVIRGTHVETHSEGTNRIKGGQVRIN